MAIVTLSSSLQSSMLSVVQNAIDAGASGGLINIYSGTMPATPDTAVTSQVLLGTLTFPTVSGTVTSQVFTAGSITPDSSANNTYTATWARITDSDNNPVLDCDVSSSAGTGAIKLNTTSIVAGGPISITALTIHF